jgi:hypothetical protein
LKAFESVSISSNYKENGNYFLKSFDFLLKEDPINNYTEGSSIEESNKTEVMLINIKGPYKEIIPRKHEIIANKIIEHCLNYFISKTCPKVTLSDEDATEILDINAIFLDRDKSVIKEEFSIKEGKFKIQYHRFYFGKTDDHYISLCANNREVERIDLGTIIQDLKAQKLKDENDKEFAFVIVVTGDYLDKNVNSERSDFNFVEDSIKDLFDVSKEELLDELKILIMKQLEKHLKDIEEDKFKEFREFAMKEKPIYRPLIKYGEKHLKPIPAGLPKEKLDIEMHKAKTNWEVELKEEGKKYFKEQEDWPNDDPQFDKDKQLFIKKVTESGGANLSEYIINRKVILNFLEKTLQIKEGSKFSLEEEVHKILFPMKTTSDDIDYQDQNLWIIDEKLSYHYYLASDLEFSQMKILDSGDKHRPDIIAFVEGEYPYNSVVIIELKKPEKRGFNKNENPIDQVLEYIDILKSEDVTGYKGEVIRLGETTKFFCYIILSLNKKIREIVGRKRDFMSTIDGLGYYDYYKSYNAYIEIIDYTKLLNDSKKRNRVLFDKLGLPL